MIGWLFWGLMFETVFQFISSRLPEKRRKKWNMIVQQATPSRTYCKHSNPLLCFNLVGRQPPSPDPTTPVEIWKKNNLKCFVYHTFDILFIK